MIVTDEMVEAAAKMVQPDLFEEESLVPEVLRNSARWDLRHRVRAALEAAVAVAPTQPETSHLDCVPAEQVQAMLDGVIETVPTREQIAEALHAHEKADPWNDAGCNDSADGAYTSCHDRYLERADVVLALFGLPALDPVSAMVRDDTARILREGPTQQIEDET